MKTFLLAIGVLLGFALSACATAAPVVPTAVPVPTATAAPPSPTAVPTVAPSPTLAPSPTTAPQPTAAPTKAAAAAQPTATTGADGKVADLSLMSTAMASATSYRATINVVKTGGQSITAVMEVVKPDKMHIKATIAGGKTTELIAIGTDFYINGNGKWIKSPVAMPLGAMLGTDPASIPGQISASQKAGTLIKGGTSQVNGVTCQLYIWTPATTSAGSTGGTVCVDVATGLLLEAKSSDGQTTVDFSDWNTNISIVAPL